ncbi:4a-hydroxytetrahydrobiopterin dehydratase [Hymenobacter taeanensis]|uniref:4a-hydroxytetrahydrobiopterin dehydratase n=1 Tax=Hymenobacter taeanensis TaxID=2735321 RepID=A0A6M6BG81_9BACT|nr:MULTISPECIES: 4a-hydroxytetrahydrobiopterin dehydratase [Hymenobacter]QJX46764.1 4a-hydroxytetrahydrobiopterin dehydratase [Hymenobacter taeanensis]UOQ80632.1 4a-hydroxytetrahydrobiopterin dehydratase [Hymenobacter sp. 5414T-23]
MWTEHDNALTRTFRFEDFRTAFSFMSDVAEEAEYQEHHPWWSNEYNVVTFRLRTHSAGHRVTEKDHQLAAAIDHLATDYGGVAE